MAVGECGLDKVCDTDFALQQDVFAAQVMLANKLEKPLIIHCVRAFEEVLHILRQQNNKVPVIFHGFSKHKELAQNLTSNGYFLSFGKSILSEKKGEILRELPLEKIFFETDNAAVKIETIYEQAAYILNLSLKQIQLQIIKNAQEVFGVKLFNK
ncbi:MAG: TatD family hydrolase [Ferruginibacter sp.]